MTLSEIMKKQLAAMDNADKNAAAEEVRKEEQHKEDIVVNSGVLGSDDKPIDAAVNQYIEGSKKIYEMTKEIEKGTDAVEDKKPTSTISRINTPLVTQENVSEVKEVTPKVQIVVQNESTKVVEKIINSAQDTTAFKNFRKRRESAMKKATMPLPMSNTFITGSPIHSNAILQAMRPQGEHDTEYDRLTRCLNIISELVEVRGVGQVNHLDLSKLVSYLELPIVYFTIYLASTNNTTTMDIPCANPNCASFAKNFTAVLDNMDLMNVEKPEVYQQLIESIKNEKNITTMMTEADTNIVKHLTLDNGNVVLIKIPTLFDYMQKTLVNVNENNRIFQDILTLCPFIQEIRLLDEDKYFALTTFEDIFEELVKYFADEDLEKINVLIEEMVVNKLVTFRLPKEKLVCPHCKKMYPQDIPLDPEQMVFQIPAMRKIEQK